MKNSLKLAIIQFDISWHNAILNRKRLSQRINSITQKVDLIILPEMFTTGFSMSPKEVAEKMDGETVEWMQKVASEKETAIAGSLIIKVGEEFYNRFLFVHPSGKIDFYNKRHLFSLAGEDKVYTKGVDKIVVDYEGWKICPQICYDLRFPVFTRNVEKYDLLLYVANWPKPRINAWDTLLKARAIENMCYVVGVNRVGEDTNNLKYTGHSAAYDCLGDFKSDKIDENECIKVFKLDKQHIEDTRSALNFLADSDNFKLQL
jgi:predicted amidohydrolase